MSQSPAAPKRPASSGPGNAPSLPAPKERRRLREAKSLSQAQVAAELGVSRATVRGWETGRTQPSGRRRVAYARFLADIAAERASGVPGPGVPGAPGTGNGPDGSGARQTLPDTGDAARAAGDKPREAGDEPREAGDEPREAGDATHATGDEARDPGDDVRATDTEARDTEDGVHATDADARDTGSGVRGTAASRGAPRGPEDAFDALCAGTAPALVRQAYALTGRRALAEESVERAFQQAWQRWPEVAVDRDPAGWVRAVAHEYALSPWHRFRPAYRHPDVPPAEEADRALLRVLLSLSPAQRRTLLLYDGVGLDLPETAAETEASTPAAAHRLMNARDAVAEQLPATAGRPDELHRSLDALGRTERLRLPRPARVRIGSERRARVWTRAAIAFTALIIGATALTVRTAPNHYEPPQSPGRAISGVPPRMGPGPLSYDEESLRQKLRKEPGNTPARLTPLPR
ncbi:helix-turn-helix domain-containing protein [Streptomyces sp. p1417]|uniref:Helix-turn-helix domain-containing protein n=1 Tax=Streptomyces typhae TaxID=2681492 RepID=A0A6L6WMT6_9ACTN|nr:helix-turn-helix domain-containing protein [Streptomyces typhae]MVO83625.1 helix-turn-helix domain-containing protein [Streptomyces typhae]